MIPFSISSPSVYLDTDALGDPYSIAFMGFEADSQYTALLEGEWATGTFTVPQDEDIGPLFIMPYNSILRTVYVLFSTAWDVTFEAGAIIKPFVCLAVSSTEDYVFTILQNTMTFTDTYTGSTDYPAYTNRSGFLTNLNIAIPEGTLVAIVAGIMAENTMDGAANNFLVSGGLYLE